MTSKDLTALSEAKVGTIGMVERIDLPEEVSHYLAHLGFLPGTEVEVLLHAPAGDPRVYRIDGVEVALRRETAKRIFLSGITVKDKAGHPASRADGANSGTAA